MSNIISKIFFKNSNKIYFFAIMASILTLKYFFIAYCKIIKLQEPLSKIFYQQLVSDLSSMQNKMSFKNRFAIICVYLIFEDITLNNTDVQKIKISD
jgi:hypothetical protein